MSFMCHIILPLHFYWMALSDVPSSRMLDLLHLAQVSLLLSNIYSVSPLGVQQCEPLPSSDFPFPFRLEHL